MRFLVRDGLDKRHLNIRKVYDQNVALGIQLAQLNFQWMMKRALISLGSKQMLHKPKQKDISYSLKQYARMWLKLSGNSGLGPYMDLVEGIKPLNVMIRKWKEFQRKGYIRRHIITKTHVSKIKKDYQRENLESLLNATEDIYFYLKNNGIDLYNRLKVPGKRKS